MATRNAARAKTARPTRRTPPSRSGWSGWPLVGVAAIVAVLVAVIVVVQRGRGGPAGDGTAAYVGGDLHAAAAFDGRLFVSGHDGAAYSDAAGAWTQIGSLQGKDGMGWATVAGAVLVGGHQGLFRSTDRGASFSPAPGNLPVTDVHALGSAGSTVYLASPQQGLFVSTDAGRNWQPRSSAGQSFMGTMLVDPKDPNHVLAPDMSTGVTETRDGGQSWQPRGGPQGAMSLAWYPTDTRHLLAVGMGGAAESRDGGATWQQLAVPDGTAVVVVETSGALIAAVHTGDKAEMSRSTDGGRNWTRI